MRKFILGALAIAAAASFGTASADPVAGGCQAAPITAQTDGGCTYTSTGNPAKVLVLTPNDVTVTWTETCVNNQGQQYTINHVAFSGAGLSPTTQGVFDANFAATCHATIPAGTTVTLTSAEDGQDPVTGTIGIAAIRETA